MKRLQRINRVHDINREWLAGTYASELFAETLRRDSGLLVNEEFEFADVTRWHENLPGTYTIRMFAEFEAALRDVWTNYFNRDTRPPMRDLIDAIAAYQGVPADVLEGAHDIRQYRNGLVHEGNEEANALEVPHVRSVLNKFLSRLPLDW